MDHLSLPRRLCARTRVLLMLVAALGATTTLAAANLARALTGRPIRVGVLHSLTGTMAISERPVVDAVLLAIDELNEQGGLLGKRVEPVLADGRSDPAVFAREAESLIAREQVSVVFGCWTSASRKSVVPAFERHNHLLFYPVQYEGLEQSPNVIYLGAAPNQQIIPAVRWCTEHLGRRVFLAGSDYIFPRVANWIARDVVRAGGGEVVGEEYVLLGSKDAAGLVRKIIDTRPSVILNTINGDSNVAFFQALRAAGVGPNQIPTMSFSIAEPELQAMGQIELAGDYAAWNYFESVDTAENRAFVARFRRKYGSARVTSDPMEAAYVAVRLWAQAVTQAGTDDVAVVRRVLRRQSLNAPEGIVSIDPATQHAWKPVRVGRVNTQKQFDIVWESGAALRPSPFPAWRPRREWTFLLEALHRKWGGKWMNPGV